MEARDRVHSLDALRAAALLSGIVLHASVFVHPGLSCSNRAFAATRFFSDGRICRAIALQIEPIRFHICRGRRGQHLCGIVRRGPMQCGDDPEDIAHLAIEAARPEVISALSVDELCRDANALACAAHASLKYRADTNSRCRCASRRNSPNSYTTCAAAGSPMGRSCYVTPNAPAWARNAAARAGQFEFREPDGACGLKGPHLSPRQSPAAPS